MLDKRFSNKTDRKIINTHTSSTLVPLRCHLPRSMLEKRACQTQPQDNRLARPKGTPLHSSCHLSYTEIGPQIWSVSQECVLLWRRVLQQGLLNLLFDEHMVLEAIKPLHRQLLEFPSRALDAFQQHEWKIRWFPISNHGSWPHVSKVQVARRETRKSELEMYEVWKYVGGFRHCRGEELPRLLTDGIGVLEEAKRPICPVFCCLLEVSTEISRNGGQL